MSDDREALLRWLEGEGSPEERARIARRLETEPGFRAELAGLTRLRDDLRALRQERFAPFFAQRVVRSLGLGRAAAHTEDSYSALRWAFVRAALACAAVALLLGAYNAAGGDLGSTLLESMLGLPSATLETALLLGAA